MNTLEEAMQRILELQDLLITEQKETLQLMTENKALKAEKDQAFKDGYSMGQYATLNIR